MGAEGTEGTDVSILHLGTFGAFGPLGHLYLFPFSRTLPYTHAHILSPLSCGRTAP